MCSPQADGSNEKVQATVSEFATYAEGKAVFDKARKDSIKNERVLEINLTRVEVDNAK